MLRFRLGVVFALLVLAASVAAAPDARAARATQPVPSLAPRDTAAQWTGLVHGHDLRPLSTTAGCRPLHAVFYAATDWLRLATKLAAQASPCAQYSVSIPPLVADKTRPRPDQAWRIRALGPSFHALAEIHLTAWQKWVNAGNGSWYQAGVEARRRMAAAGYDVGAGDTWALNELSSAVRRGDGTWRTDVRELVRGLFDAGGEQPPAPGVVFVVGVGQRVTSVATYKARLQEWLQDSAFWVDMNAYVGDWAQEVYGDVRSYAAPGSSVSQRRDALTDYLDHSDLLARAGGAVSGTASAFFSRTASPLGSAAWQWDGSFGWTLVDAPLMQQFVSTQVYAMRSHDASLGRPDDRWGFAWAPRNPGSVPKNEFASAAGAVLDRLAAAIRDSGGDSPVRSGRARLWAARQEPLVRRRPGRGRPHAELGDVPHVVADHAHLRHAPADRRRRRRLDADHDPATGGGGGSAAAGAARDDDHHLVADGHARDERGGPVHPERDRAARPGGLLDACRSTTRTRPRERPR